MTDEANDPIARALGLSQEEDWSWTRKYNPGLFLHMHALGVIAANYNRLEAQLRFLLYVFMDRAMPTAFIFECLSNPERTAVLEQLYDEAIGGTELANRLDWFVFGYGKCVQNRNILMHSEPHGAAFNALQIISALELRKASKKNPGDRNFISVELKELRRVADDIDRFATFGVDLALCEFARKQGGTIRLGEEDVSPPLPDQPPEPILLKLSSREANSSPPPYDKPG